MAEIEPGDRPGQWVVQLDGMDQSYVDLDDPTQLRFDYVRRTGELLDAAAEPGAPLRVLHVGGGGLTLARYVLATRPGSRQVVLEPDAALVASVRTLIPLPPRSGISVRTEDGRAGLAGVRDGWAGAVVVAAFAGAVVPASLVTTEAFAELARVLSPGGLVVINVRDRAPFRAARDVLAGMRASFPDLAVGAETATWRGRREGNLLLVAGARPAAGDPAYRWVSGAAVSDALGGGRERHDAP